MMSTSIAKLIHTSMRLTRALMVSDDLRSRPARWRRGWRECWDAHQRAGSSHEYPVGGVEVSELPRSCLPDKEQGPERCGAERYRRPSRGAARGHVNSSQVVVAR